MSQKYIRSNLYGESLFVTLLATPQKELIFVEQHWHKLKCELNLYNLAWDEELDKNKLSIQVENALISQNYHRVRLNYQLLAAAWPMLRSSKSNQEKLVGEWYASALVTPIDFSLEHLPTKRVKAFVKAMDPRIRFNCKVGSLGHESLYFLKQDNSEWDDYLWVNPDQTIRECATSNVFVVLKNGEWITAGHISCYAGVTREALLSWLPNQGIKVSVREFSLNDLTQANCLVFTNAIQLFGLIELEGINAAKPEVVQWLLELRVKFFLDMQLQTGGKLKI